LNGVARLPRVAALDLVGFVDAAWRLHGAGAEQHITFVQRVLDCCDHLKSPPRGLHIIAGADKCPCHEATPGQLTEITGSLPQPWTVHRPGLALQDDAINGGEFVERGQADITDLGAEALQGAGDLINAAFTSGSAGMSVSWKRRMKPMRRPRTPRSNRDA
jgi:hypothetical protein